MAVTILPDFEAFTRRQVEAGVFASEQDALDAALRDCLAEHESLRASLRQAAQEIDRGEDVDGEAFMAELLAESEARAAQAE